MKQIRLFLINYTVLITLLFSIEIIGHFAYRILKGKYTFEHKPKSQVIFKEHPYLVGVPKSNFELTNTSGDIKISTDKYGHRITKDYKPSPEAIKIVCIGGSTTFATGVTDSESWPYLLQQKLGRNYNVINLGVPGYTTLEGIIQITTIIPEIKPDILISYQGWNDLRNYHIPKKSPDYLWHGNTQKNNLSVRKNSGLLQYSFIYFVAKKINERVRSSKNLTKPKSHTDTYEDQIYSRNLETIQSLCDRFSIKSIFVPQALNLESYAGSKDPIEPWTPFITKNKIPKLIKHFNSLLYTHINENQKTVVIDSILYKYPWKNMHFVDYGHFSKKGGELFTEIIIPAIKKLDTVSK